MNDPILFSPITLAAAEGPGIQVRNRAFIAPMCQYSVEAKDGVPTDWHLQQLGSFAAGGFGLVTTEATAVEPHGRISPRDLGIWNDEQLDSHARIVAFEHSQGAIAAVQLAHAGMKASTYPGLPGFTPGYVPEAEGGWQTRTPENLSKDDIAEIVGRFAQAAQRADQAGYDVVQLHGAHGYLMHEFLSPLTNKRTDEYGGDETGRSRFVREIVSAVRAVWPAGKPLGIRFSATDWVENGWDVDATARLAQVLVADHGVTWIDASSGGLGNGTIPVGPGYQVPLASRIKTALDGTNTVVSAVGLITKAQQAETILATGQPDAISVGRAALRDPHWAAAAAAELGVPRDQLPSAPQLHRANW